MLLLVIRKRVYNIVKFENDKKFNMQIVSGFPKNKKIIIFPICFEFSGRAGLIKYTLPNLPQTGLKWLK